jgi:hypothetical protein
MENSLTTLEKLVQKAEVYGKTTLELHKHKTIFKSAEIGSRLAVKAIVAAFFCLFSIFVNIGLSFWIGKELGEAYLGFFVVSAIYLVIGILAYLFRKSLIESPVCNNIIKQLQKKTTYENN